MYCARHKVGCNGDFALRSAGILHFNQQPILFFEGGLLCLR